MRTLLLLRHAKSSWGDVGLPDHERPLAPRGRIAAPAVGRFMFEEGLVPELVLCSTAVRTRETWALIEPELGGGVHVEYEEGLYGASAGTLLYFVKSTPDDLHRGTCRRAIGSGSEKAARRLAAKYPTAALAQLSCDADHWADITVGGCRLDRFVRPGDLPGVEDRTP